MQTHDQLVKKLLRRLGMRAEAERIEREEAVLPLAGAAYRAKFAT